MPQLHWQASLLIQPELARCMQHVLHPEKSSHAMLTHRRGSRAHKQASMLPELGRGRPTSKMLSCRKAVLCPSAHAWPSRYSSLSLLNVATVLESHLQV